MSDNKTILVVNQNDFPVVGAHVVNVNGPQATITNLDGVARISASNEHTIRISHVSGETKHYRFSNLPEVVKLQENELDEVIVIAQKKPKNNLAMIFASLMVAGLVVSAKNKK